MMLHHVEIWVPSLDASWEWLLTRLGYTEYQRFEGGVSYLHGDTYLVFETSPAMTREPYDRMRPGLNHLAFHCDDAEALADEALAHGWRLMFADRHPYAGGPDYHAAYLENDAGFEVELVTRRRDRVVNS